MLWLVNVMERGIVLVSVLGLLIVGIAVTAQSYMSSRQFSGLESQINLINQEIDAVWEEINTLKVGNSTNGTMDFTFAWGSQAQNIVNGTFKIDVSVWFENHTNPWDNTTCQMFYIVINVYDDDYGSDDYLGLVFDMNHNGTIDLGFEDRPRFLYVNNSTIGVAALGKEGFLAPAEVPRKKAYMCTYDPEKGYAFGPFGGPTSDFASKFGDMPAYIPIHLCFVDANLYPDLQGVSAQFRIYINS